MRERSGLMKGAAAGRISAGLTGQKTAGRGELGGQTPGRRGEGTAAGKRGGG